jgi:hypothetical protein
MENNDDIVHNKISDACEQFKETIKSLGKKNVVVVFGYIDTDEHDNEAIRAGSSGDSTFELLGFIEYVRSMERQELIKSMGPKD